MGDALGSGGGLALVARDAAELEDTSLERDARELADLHAHGPWSGRMCEQLR